MTRITSDRISLPFSTQTDGPMTSSIIGVPADQPTDSLSQSQKSEKSLLSWVWDGFWNFWASIWDLCFTKPQLRKDKARITKLAGTESLARKEIKEAAEIAVRHPDNDEIQDHFKDIKDKIGTTDYQIWRHVKGSDFDYRDPESIVNLMKVCIEWENSKD